MCFEKGVYIINFDGCNQCKDSNRAPDALKVKAHSKEDVEDDGIEKEIITFERKKTYFII